MPRLADRRPSATLSSLFQRNLYLYGLASSAAGVSLLALVPPSQAEIVYTAAHEQIGRNSTVPIDFNHDGINDFFIRNATVTQTGFLQRRLQAVPKKGGGILANVAICFASDLPAGAEIGGKELFCSKAAASMIGYSTAFDGTYWGLWAPKETNRYLGVKFVIDGQVHYGWARVNAELYFPYINALLTGYAYETTANRPIRAGDEGQSAASQVRPKLSRPTLPERAVETRSSGTLGALALGAQGLSIWRREEMAASD